MKKICVALSIVLLMAVILSACAGTPVLKGRHGVKEQEQLVKKRGTGQEVVFCAPLIKSIQLSRSSLTLQEGEQDLLCLAVLPVDASREGLSWSVEDERIAEVNEGVVTAKKQGTTAVHVKSNDGRFDLKCTVTVVPAGEEKTVQAEDAFTNERATKHEQIVIQAACGDVFPLSVAYEALQELTVRSYESEDESIVGIDSFGLVYALSPGSAVLRVYTSESEIEFLIEVEEVHILLTDELPDQKCVVTGDRFSVTKDQPFEGEYDLTICSSDGEIAAVDGRDIVALAKGSVQIWIYHGDEPVYELFLTVTE